jgi:hypothetical protein
MVIPGTSAHENGAVVVAGFEKQQQQQQQQWELLERTMRYH